MIYRRSVFVVFSKLWLFSIIGITRPEPIPFLANVERSSFSLYRKKNSLTLQMYSLCLSTCFTCFWKDNFPFFRNSKFQHLCFASLLINIIYLSVTVCPCQLLLNPVSGTVLETVLASSEADCQAKCQANEFCCVFRSVFGECDLFAGDYVPSGETGPLATASVNCTDLSPCLFAG